MSAISRSGARILVDQLKIHGADTVFGIPGESYLAVLDALHDTNSIRYVICRQEGGAAMMADAYGKLTGKPGICMVTRGPGATNASSGVHVAFQDSTPLILFIGQVGRDMMEREAFQEIDYRRMYGQMAKWVAEIDDPARIPEFIARAFATATSGRPGPVVLALPEDMLVQLASVADAMPYRPALPAPAGVQIDALRARLAASQRPLMIVGGRSWSDQACADLRRFAERNGVPVASSFRTQDIFDNAHSHYAGHVGIGIDPKLAERVRTSDCLMVLGARLGEMTTSAYTLLDSPTPKQPLIHIYPDPEELGRVFQSVLPIVAAPAPMAAALADMEPVDDGKWRSWRESANADYEATLAPLRSPGAVQMAEIVGHLREVLPSDAIISNGAGNYTIWVHRFYRYRRRGTQLAPTSGSMGYGMPAAVAAKAVHPDRVAVCFAGDGCFQMTMQEFGTAAQLGIDPIVIVVNNGMYGTIRMHQEREYPSRVSGTELHNPDFVAFARAYGAHAERVARTEDFPAAFARARAAKKLALIELILDPEALTPRQTLSEIRAAAQAANNATAQAKSK